MSFRLIYELQTKAIPVAQSCRVLGISRSGFYEAKRRACAPTVCKVSAHVRAAFVASHQSYGSRRMVTVLSNRGVTAGRFKVRRLMRQAGLKPVWKRKFIHTTDWVMVPSMPAKLVCDALHMAVQQRRPDKGLVVHSDRGSQGGFNWSSQH